MHAGADHLIAGSKRPTISRIMSPDVDRRRFLSMGGASIRPWRFLQATGGVDGRCSRGRVTQRRAGQALPDGQRMIDQAEHATGCTRNDVSHHPRGDGQGRAQHGTGPSMSGWYSSGGAASGSGVSVAGRRSCRRTSRRCPPAEVRTISKVSLESSDAGTSCSVAMRRQPRWGQTRVSFLLFATGGAKNSRTRPHGGFNFRQAGIDPAM